MIPPAEVVAYFADDPTRTYQLSSWLPVLEVLHEHRPVVVVTREPASAEILRGRTSLPVLLAESLTDLTELYERLDPKIALYCNNSPLNFNSLISSRMLHVHVNHGESDKQSMASNCAKAYDRVFVAGPAAVERYITELMELDASRLVRVGRPQLDLHPAPLLPPTTRRTVLYAPTWEGDADYNDYGSLPTLGRDIVRAALALPDVRVVYKPHPKVVTSRTPRVRRAHADVLEMLAGPDHVAVTGGDILAVFPGCDLMVTDVSSVGPDWLYLRNEQPIFLTDPHHDLERLRREIPLSRCADVLDTASHHGDVAELTALFASRLEYDEHHLARVAVRRHYFDDLAVGASTDRFLDAVADLVMLRDRLLDARITA
ncbi:CDP-glycerol--glycerophosphate glycerophosphotransferase [Nocardioides mangrovicus]|uniref:CDP-glycerol--glycerophosphate glycerophosphotransferase n=1 Tax=Nocardioides mangrovicus TaxID=2478913 RepID=A0A3L8P2G5_9ACTN|nr:CDP-glycerol glycerophosphotransferase family protein [Nocardioides mangrovicus]RLV49043.1 CDP-glycerol--glycerophosphate glycerophosphotransferase [Nocardioides mangrovicus]